MGFVEHFHFHCSLLQTKDKWEDGSIGCCIKMELVLVVKMLSQKNTDGLRF